MSTIKYNTLDLTGVKYNGTSCTAVKYNGVQIWTSVVQQPTTVTFTNTTTTYGIALATGAGNALNATTAPAGVVGPVTYTYNGNNAVGAQLPYSATAYTIIANFTPTTAGFDPSSDTGTITVNKAAAPTFTVSSFSKTYGDVVALPTFTVNGLKYTDTLTYPSMSCTGTIGTAGIGTHPVVWGAKNAGFPAANYNTVTEPSVSITVNKKTINIRPTSIVKTYGEVKTLAFTYDAMPNGESISSVSYGGTGVVAAGAGMAYSATPYPLTASAAVGAGTYYNANNYTFNYVAATVIVNRATPSVNVAAAASVSAGTTVSANGTITTTAGTMRFMYNGSWTAVTGVYKWISGATYATQGSFTPTVRFHPTDTTNFNTADVALALTVTAAMIDQPLTWNITASYGYTTGLTLRVTPTSTHTTLTSLRWTVNGVVTTGALYKDLLMGAVGTTTTISVYAISDATHNQSNTLSSTVTSTAVPATVNIAATTTAKFDVAANNTGYADNQASAFTYNFPANTSVTITGRTNTTGHLVTIADGGVTKAGPTANTCSWTNAMAAGTHNITVTAAAYTGPTVTFVNGASSGTSSFAINGDPKAAGEYPITAEQTLTASVTGSNEDTCIELWINDISQPDQAVTSGGSSSVSIDALLGKSYILSTWSGDY